MSILIFALVLIIVLAIVVYIIRLLPLGQPWQNIAVAIVCLIGLLVLLSRFGFLTGLG